MMGHQDQGVPKESEDLQDCQDSQEHRDFQVFLDRMGPRVLWVHQGATERRVKEDSRETPDSQVYMVLRVQLVYRDPRVIQAS